MNSLAVPVWGAIICAQVWIAAGRRDLAFWWMVVAVVTLVAWIVALLWDNLRGFWSRVWSR